MGTQMVSPLHEVSPATSLEGDGAPAQSPTTFIMSIQGFRFVTFWETEKKLEKNLVLSFLPILSCGTLKLYLI